MQASAFVPDWCIREKKDVVVVVKGQFTWIPNDKLYDSVPSFPDTILFFHYNTPDEIRSSLLGSLMAQPHIGDKCLIVYLRVPGKTSELWAVRQ